MECRSDHGCRRTALAFRDHARDERCRVEYERAGATHGDGIGVAPGVGPIDGTGQGLELDRGLRLVRDAGPAAEERGDCVEQAADAARHWYLTARREVEDGVHGRGVDVVEQFVRIRAGELRPHRGHAPRLADCGDTAWHRHGTKMPDALEPAEIREQVLATPECAVGSVAEPVEGEPQHWFGTAVLHHARGNMRVVVLHRHRWKVEVERELRGQVLRMEIVRDHFGAYAVERGQVVDRLEERPIRREVLEVSDVMTRDDDVATRDGHGRLQLCTDRQHRALRGERERHGLGCVPA